MRDRRLESVEAIIQRKESVAYRNATMTASSSLDSNVDFGSLGPVLQSAVELRFFHLATVLGLMPWRVASCLKLS